MSNMTYPNPLYCFLAGTDTISLSGKIIAERLPPYTQPKHKFRTA